MERKVCGRSDAGPGKSSLRRKPVYLGVVATLVLGACGGGGNASVVPPPVDAPPVDAPPVDAPPVSTMPTITVNVTGAGTVTSAPAGIDCSTSCQTSFAAGTRVTLTATPGHGATFTGWTGACVGTGACVVTAEGAVTVGATFTAGCAEDCSAGEIQCLSTTTQRTCGQFDDDPCLDWSPPTACPGAERCTLGRCGAEHELTVLPLAEVAVGTVTSTPAGITCGLDGTECQRTYADGTQVTLTATSDPEAVFAGWALLPLGDTNAQACVGSLAPCTVTMSEVTTIAATYCTPECPLGGVRCSGATNVIATCGEFDGDPCTEFGPPSTCGAGLLCTPAGCQAGFVVTAAAEGAGAVAIDGVTCQAPPCTQGVVTGGSARITAIPGPASAFTGWTGACTGSGPCTVTSAGTVTAHFVDRCVDALVVDAGGFAIESSSLAVGSELFIGKDSGIPALLHAPLDGTPPTLATIAAGPMWSLTADTSGAYWLEGFDPPLELVSFAGGARHSVAQNLGFGAIALGDTDVFLLQGTSIMKVAKTGGTPVMVAAVPGEFGAGLAVDATSIYWGRENIQKFPIAGGAGVTLVPDTGVVNRGAGFVVAQDATFLYWARSLPEPAAIVRVPKAGGPVESVVAAHDVMAIALRGTTLAWISAGQPPHATTIGSGVVTQLGRRLANNGGQPGISIDTAAVYVTAKFDGPGSQSVISRLVRSATCAP